MPDLTALSLHMYRQNPFRLLGLDPSARRREIRRRLTELLSYVELNDTDALRGAVRGGFTALPDEAALRQAVAALEDPLVRLVDEVFWFRSQGEAEAENANPLIGSTPINVAETVAAWIDQEDGTDLVPTHNLAVFHHLMALEVEQRLAEEVAKAKGGADDLARALRQECDYCWRHALARWSWLHERSAFHSWLKSRASEIGGEVIDANSDFRGLPVAILALNARLALAAATGRNAEDARRHRELMREAGFGGAAVDEAMEIAAEPLIRRLRERLESFRTEINHANKAALAGPTRDLLDDVIPALEALDQLLSGEDGRLVDLHEMLAETVNIAQVAGWGKTGHLAFAVEVLTRIEGHARSANLKKQLARNLELTRCFFCKARPGLQGCAVEIEVYKITGVDPRRTGVIGSRATIEVPRCRECQNAHHSGETRTADGTSILPVGKASDFVILAEHLDQGWKRGMGPSGFEVQQAIQNDLD